jgi:putative PIN family toxin of toxin-antitoxin system
MMRIVLDASVPVCALISAKGTPARLLEYWEAGSFDIVISPAILEELERVLHYPKLQQQYHLPEEDIRRFLRLLKSQATEVLPSKQLTVIEHDPTDNRYLECALEGDAQYLVSGDRHLLALKEYRGIRMLSPLEFVALLRLEGESPEA